MDIIKKVTKDAERLLKSLKAKYYIELPTGEQIWHDLDGYELRVSEEAKPERKKRTTRSGLPFGALSAYYRPIVDKCLNPGDIATIPFGEFEPDQLRGAIAAYCSVMWGKRTYTSVLNRAAGQVEVMRTSKNTVTKPAAGLSKSQEKRVAAQTKVNGNGHVAGERAKFRTVGHGMDALANLEFDEPQK